MDSPAPPEPAPPTWRDRGPAAFLGIIMAALSLWLFLTAPLRWLLWLTLPAAVDGLLAAFTRRQRPPRADTTPRLARAELPIVGARAHKRKDALKRRSLEVCDPPPPPPPADDAAAPAIPTSFCVENQFAGLGLSGGGIRSAAFNLGLIQSLVRQGIFSLFDYLATVSGGGYTGCLVSGATASPHRDPNRGWPINPDSTTFDPALVNHLRQHPQYLTPSIQGRLRDWAEAAGIILQGTLAHLVMGLIAFGVVAVPFMIVDPGWKQAADCFRDRWGDFLAMWIVWTLLLLFLRIFAWANDQRALIGRLVAYALVPAVVGALATIAAQAGPWLKHFGADAIAGGRNVAVLGGVLSTLLGAVASWLMSSRPALSRAATVVKRLAILMLLGGLTILSFVIFHNWLPRLYLSLDIQSTLSGVRRLLVLVLVICAVVSLVRSKPGLGTWLLQGALALVIIVLGFSTSRFVTFLDGVGSKVAAWAPGGLRWLFESSDPVLILSSFFLLAACALIGRQPLIRILATTALCGLVVWSWWWLNLREPHPEVRAPYDLYLWLLTFQFAFCVFFNLNKTSLHDFYRRRLTAAFLTVRREGDVDLPLSAAAGDGPYHLLLAAANFPSSEQRLLAERRCESFLLSPKLIGSESTAYRAPEADLRLGMAMAISGAAVNSHAGGMMPRSLSALLTLLNLRLGYWLPNPALLDDLDGLRGWRSWWRRLPLACTVWPVYFMRELLSSFEEESPHVFLSDGGHFDNLGLYELVRRQCRFILISDAGADLAHSFADLGNAIRRCRTDHGCEIDIDIAALRRDPERGGSASHVAIGRLDYRDGGCGILVYVKASLTGDEPADVLQYAAGSSTFPHQSTANQFFDEAQFEAYRRLGEHIAKEVFLNLPTDDGETLFERARDRWQAGGISDGVYHELADDFSTLEESPLLQAHGALDHTQYEELFPEGHPDEAHGDVHFVTRQLQLMESVWTELRLRDSRAQGLPANRGWMNLFRRWSLSPRFRTLWPVLRPLYGLEFQRFCEESLDLPGDAELLAPVESRRALDPEWAVCEGMLRGDPLGRLQHSAWLRMRNEATILARLRDLPGAVVGFVTLRAAGTHDVELAALMTDRRFFYTGVSTWLRDAVEHCYGGRTAFIRMSTPAEAVGAPEVLETQWRRMIRFYSRLGFSAREGSADSAAEIDVRARTVLGGSGRYMWRHLRRVAPATTPRP